MSVRQRLVMILCGFTPLVHAAGATAPLVLIAAGAAGPGALLLAPLLLYVVPAIVVGASLRVWPLPSGAHPVGSRVFLWWWFTAQWQVLFARLPILEELLRLVPGLYSAWLRLWGAHIGGLVYWSPGVAITDRSLVKIGARVIFGLGARLNAHVMAPAPDGAPRLLLAPIVIGGNTLVGAYSLVLAGCEVDSGEVTPPLKTLHPFTRLARGRRMPVPGSPLARESGRAGGISPAQEDE